MYSFGPLRNTCFRTSGCFPTEGSDEIFLIVSSPPANASTKLKPFGGRGDRGRERFKLCLSVGRLFHTLPHQVADTIESIWSLPVNKRQKH